MDYADWTDRRMVDFLKNFGVGIVFILLLLSPSLLMGLLFGIEVMVVVLVTMMGVGFVTVIY